MGERDRMRAAESFLEGIQRAGADVAEDHADRADGETQRSPAATCVGVGIVARVGCGGRRRGSWIRFH